MTRTRTTIITPTNVRELLESRQSAFIVYPTFFLARMALDEFVDSYPAFGDIVRSPSRSAIVFTNKLSRQTIGQTYVAFISADSSPEALKASRAIVLFAEPLDRHHPNADLWKQTAGLLERNLR